MSNKNILLSSNIIRSENKTYKIFIDYIAKDFREIKSNTPHKYVAYCWEKYRTTYPFEVQSQALNRSIFDVIIKTCFFRENIFPMFLCANFTVMPNVSFDIVLFNSVTNYPIGISIRTNLKERYRQTDLEAIALKYVHIRSENYLICLKSDEVDTVKKKIKRGELLGLDRVIAADTTEFDELIEELKKNHFIQPEKVDVVTGNIVKGV